MTLAAPVGVAAVTVKYQLVPDLLTRGIATAAGLSPSTVVPIGCCAWPGAPAQNVMELPVGATEESSASTMVSPEMNPGIPPEARLEASEPGAGASTIRVSPVWARGGLTTPLVLGRRSTKSTAV